MSKICSKCLIEKLFEDFGSRKDIKDNLRNQCKLCISIHQISYKKTLNGFLNKLLSSAKKNSKNRLNVNRIDAGVFDITFNDLNELCENQKGLCYYSKLPMNFDKNSWKCSLERLDPIFGYIKHNIALCCIEFNSCSQWSNYKINEMVLILNKNIDNNYVDFNNYKKQLKKQVKIKLTILNGENYYNCSFCGLVKQRDQFNKRINRGCIECFNEYYKKLSKCPRYKLQKILSHAKLRANKKGMNFDLDFDYLVSLFNNQRGLCAYSNLPLTFGSYFDINWVISLERIDTLIGYTKNNVCLICIEFNTMDNSILGIDDSKIIGWNKDKFNKFYQNINKPNLTP